MTTAEYVRRLGNEFREEFRECLRDCTRDPDHGLLIERAKTLAQAASTVGK